MSENSEETRRKEEHKKSVRGRETKGNYYIVRFFTLRTRGESTELYPEKAFGWVRVRARCLQNAVDKATILLHNTYGPTKYAVYIYEVYSELDETAYKVNIKAVE